jgi:Tfp pilus assembly protein PilP
MNKLKFIPSMPESWIAQMKYTEAQLVKIRGTESLINSYIDNLNQNSSFVSEDVKIAQVKTENRKWRPNQTRRKHSIERISKFLRNRQKKH